MSNIDYFKNEECNRLFYNWGSNHPHSFLNTDMDRFTRMVICILDSNENLEVEYVRASAGVLMDERMIDTYISRYQSMKDMYNALNDDKRLLFPNI